MTNKDKIEWAKRAFAEIATICDGVAALDIVSAAERTALGISRGNGQAQHKD